MANRMIESMIKAVNKGYTPKSVYEASLTWHAGSSVKVNKNTSATDPASGSVVEVPAGTVVSVIQAGAGTSGNDVLAQLPNGSQAVISYYDLGESAGTLKKSSFKEDDDQGDVTPPGSSDGTPSDFTTDVKNAASQYNGTTGEVTTDSVVVNFGSADDASQFVDFITQDAPTTYDVEYDDGDTSVTVFADDSDDSGDADDSDNLGEDVDPETGLDDGTPADGDLGNVDTTADTEAVYSQVTLTKPLPQEAVDWLKQGFRDVDGLSLPEIPNDDQPEQVTFVMKAKDQDTLAAGIAALKDVAAENLVKTEPADADDYHG